jgi:hypothetical protein
MQRYLLPVRWIVKRDRGLEVIHFQWCRAENAWKLNEVARVARVRTWPRQYRHARKGQRIPRHAVVHFQYGCGSSAPEGWLLRRYGMLDANDHFMDGIGERKPRNFLTHMRSFSGHGRDYWLWDFVYQECA